MRQFDAADCGAAALLSVLRFHGGNASFPDVRDLAHTDANGATMLSLVTAARALGFDAKGARGTYEQLMAEPLPAVAHIVTPDQQPHYVVVYDMRPDRVVVGDPAAGVRAMPRAAFEALWVTRTVVLLRPSGALRQAPPRHWTRWLAAYLRQDHVWLSQTVFVAVVQTLLGLLVAVFIQLLVDDLIPKGRVRLILVTGALLLALQLVRGGIGYLRERLLLELNRRVGVHINDDFLARVFAVPLRFFRTRRKGDITARIQDVVRIQTALLALVGTSVVDAFVLVGSFAMLLVIAPSAAPIGLVACVACAAIVLGLSGRLRQRQREVAGEYSAVESRCIDALDGIEDIRSYNASPTFLSSLSTSFSSLQGRIQDLGIVHGGIGLLAEMTAAVVIVGSLTAGAVLVARGDLELGRMMAAYSLLAGIVPAALRLADANLSVQALSVSAERLFDLIQMPPETEGGHGPFALRRALVVEGVTFAWRGGAPTLKDVNLTVRVGEVTGLWGETGTGKSTLVGLLQGRAAPDAGSIRVDGVPYEEIALAEVRRNVAVVPAAVKIFNGSLAQNVLVGRAISPERLVERTDELGLDGLVGRFPAGFLTPLGEDGRRLSSGEQQLVALLRAMLDEPALLILDEGLNAMDRGLRATVFDLIAAYAAAHAVLMISHDPDALARADSVYLMSGGTVSEQVAGAAFQKRWSASYAS